ncbi:carbohydrate-binding family 9-like protein [Paenibacillus pini]
MSLYEIRKPNIDFTPSMYTCRRAEQKLELDGRVNKPFWSAADWTKPFVNIEGPEASKPAKQTRVKMLWDDEHFYFAAELEEDQIWATMTERESPLFLENNFEIFIDPDGDTHNYYELEINALNTIWDLMLTKPYRDGGVRISAWDIQGLKTAVYIDGEVNKPDATNRMWSVEVAIPWISLLECAPGRRLPVSGEYWRVNYCRIRWEAEHKNGVYEKSLNPETGEFYPEDISVWSPHGLINMHYPDMWGYVVFAESNESEWTQLPVVEQMKWDLRRLYYLQHKQFKRFGSFAHDLEMLMHLSDEKWSIVPQMQSTERMFEISAPIPGSSSRLYLRDDGRVWKE